MKNNKQIIEYTKREIAERVLQIDKAVSSKEMDALIAMQVETRKKLNHLLQIEEEEGGSG